MTFVRLLKVDLRWLDPETVAALARKAWQWWLNELRGMVPSSLEGFLPDGDDAILIDVMDDKVVIGRVHRSVYKEIDRVARMGEDGAIGPLSVDRRRSLSDGARATIVRLPPESALYRKMALPLVAPRDLVGLLELEIDCQSPLAPETILFAHRVVRRDRTAKRLDVELRIVRRDALSRAEALCRSLGIIPSGYTIQGDEQRGFGPIMAKRPWAAAAGARSRAVLLVMAALVPVLVGANVAANRYRGENDRSHLTTLVAEQKAKARVVDDLRKELDRARHRADILNARRRAPLVSETLAEVSRLLPDGSWLFQLEAMGDDVRVRGYSPSASALIEIFDNSERFTAARFRAPLTPGPRPDLERFDLSFSLKREGP